MKTKECRKCGREFPWEKSAQQCELCRYLSKYYRRRKHNPKVVDINRPPMSYIPVPCECCGELTPRRPNTSNARWCSDKCRQLKKKRDSGIAPRQAAAKRSKVQFPKCMMCGNHYCLATSGAKRPGYTKKYSVASTAYVKKDRCKRCDGLYPGHITKVIISGSITTNCKTCNILFSRMPGGSARCCSDECSKASDRADKARRRKASKEGDSFDPLMICYRDGWKCKHCGKRTPKKRRGTIASNAPEIDHIVPLSVGGRHTKDNVQLLCRSCNQAKGSGSLHDQTLLFG